MRQLKACSPTNVQGYHKIVPPFIWHAQSWPKETTNEWDSGRHQPRCPISCARDYNLRSQQRKMIFSLTCFCLLYSVHLLTRGRRLSPRRARKRKVRSASFGQGEGFGGGGCFMEVDTPLAEVEKTLSLPRPANFATTKSACAVFAHTYFRTYPRPDSPPSYILPTTVLR